MTNSIPINYNKPSETATQKPAAWTEQKDRSREVRMQQIASVALASSAATLALLSTAFAFTLSPLFLIPAAYSVVVAVLGVLCYQTIVDYDDPRVVAQLRKEMENMPLSKILAKHRLNDVCKVLSKEEFYDKFVADQKHASFRDAFYDYKKMKTTLEQLGVKDFPVPKQWQEKLKQEIVKLPLIPRTYSYDLKELTKLNLINPDILFCLNLKYRTEISNLEELSSKIANTPPAAVNG